ALTFERYGVPKRIKGLAMRCSRLCRVVLLLTLGCLLSVGQPAAIAATTPTAARGIATVKRQVRALKRSSFAKASRRASTVNALSRASSALRRNLTCSALKAADKAFGLLGDPATWKGRRIPRAVSRKPGILSRLAAVERRLARRKCAASVGTTTSALKPQRGGGNLKPLPAPVEDEHEQGEGIPTPAGVYVPPGAIGTTLQPIPDPYGRGVEGGAPQGRSLRAGPPLNFFRSSDVGTPPRSAEPQEPTTATGGGISVFTGNSSVAFSKDSGSTWSRYDPSTLLADSGLPFCCDQSVTYSKSANIFVWLLQYWCSPGTSNPATNDCRNGSTGGNRIRIAVATPKNLRDNFANPGAAWTYWNLPPSLFGEPTNAWFDRGDISVNASFMNLGIDILRGRSGHRSLLARTPLSQLAARGTISISFITDSPQRVQVAQGEGTSWTYFAGSNSLSQARLWSWAPWSGTLFLHAINHASVPVDNGAALGSTGSDWHNRWGTWPGGVESATVAGSTLVLAQATGRDNNAAPPASRHVFDRDAIYISRFNTNTWTLASQRWLWNPTLNFGFPALGTNSAGEVGITFVGAPNNANPQPIAGYLNPDEQFVFALPAGQPHTAGDYYSLRPGRTAQSFVMPMRTREVDSDGVTRTHWRYLEYGHGTPFAVRPPLVSLTSPTNDRSFQQGANIHFAASVFDPQDTDVPASAIVWRSDGVEIGRGAAIDRSNLPVGDHVIRVTATDGEGLSTSAQITIHVLRLAGPSVAITSPADGTEFFATDGSDQVGQWKDVQFAATATDPGARPLTYTWTDAIGTAAPVVVSNALSPLLRLRVAGFNCGLATHNLVLSVTNGVDTSQAAVSVRVRTVNCLG
ncbi:MAG: hypothetical protein QOJ46_82, partial [bacterium]